jgi:hypothetical protein
MDKSLKDQCGIRVLEAGEREGWTAVLNASVRHDFHHLPQYHQVSEKRGEGRAALFVYHEEEHFIALPLLLRPVDAEDPGGWQDATSVYGYAGPVSSHETMPANIVENFQRALASALEERRVVAVFSRLHPLIEQRHLLSGLGECRENGHTISIDLQPPLEEQITGYSKSCRDSLKKLRKHGFVGVHDQEKRYLPEFISIYHETMRRVTAASSYFFDEAYFTLLTQELGAVSQLFVVLTAGQVAAATLCTICNGIVQDHLGGTRSEFLKYSPDRLVVDTERLWAKTAGAQVFHLGGGVGAQQDSVFRYKSGFSDRRHSFCTWRWIINAGVYEELCAERTRTNEVQGLRAGASGYFPAYRCPTAPVDTAEAERSGSAQDASYPRIETVDADGLPSCSTP